MSSWKLSLIVFEMRPQETLPRQWAQGIGTGSYMAAVTRRACRSHHMEACAPHWRMYLKNLYLYKLEILYRCDLGQKSRGQTSKFSVFTQVARGNASSAWHISAFEIDWCQGSMAPSETMRRTCKVRGGWLQVAAQAVPATGSQCFGVGMWFLSWRSQWPVEQDNWLHQLEVDHEIINKMNVNSRYYRGLIQGWSCPIPSHGRWSYLLAGGPIHTCAWEAPRQYRQYILCSIPMGAANCSLCALFWHV